MTLRPLSRAVTRLLVSFCLLAGGLGTVIATSPSHSVAQAQEVEPLALVEEDQHWLDRAETYLNSIRSLRARFVQIAPEGGVAEGTFYLRRPGRLRVEYDPPVPILIVGDGTFLHYHDQELGQISDWPIFATPLGALSDDVVRFNDELIVIGFTRRSGVLIITVTQEEDPGQGSLTLFFTEQPLALKQWKVTDAQGLVTTVGLHDIELNVELSAKLFVFDDPREKTIQRR